MQPQKFKTINNKLLPFRQYDENDVVNLYALDTTGEAGMFVVPTAFDPSHTDGMSDVPVGAEFDGVYSFRYKVNNTITPAPSGATKWDVLGVTLNDTREYDENGNRLIYNPQKKLEMQCVLSGEAVPVLTKGIVTLAKGAYTGEPEIGKVGVIDPENPGAIKALAPAELDDEGLTAVHVLGKFISSESDGLGGYALFKLEL